MTVPARSDISASDGAATDSGDGARITPELLKLAGVIMLGAIMVQLDSTMVNVAIDRLSERFDATVSTIQWVSTGYLLAMAIVIPLTGWAVDRFGARATWAFSLSSFLIGSVLCGVAWSAESLIVFRVIQGLGGGMILPLAQAILAAAAGPQRLGRMMSAIGVPAMLGPVLGPVLGGVLVDHLSWRWIFYVNVPICLAALALSWRLMPAGSTASAERKGLDKLGLLLLSPGCAALVYGLSEAGQHGSFTAREVLIPLIAGVLLLAAFAWHSLWTAGEPIIDLRLLRSRNFAASSGVLLVFGMAMFGAIFLLSLLYQQVHGDSAVRAGLLLAPQGLGLAVALLLAGPLTDKIGPRWIAVTGLVLAAVGTIPFALAKGEVNQLVLGAALVVRGAGLGAILVPCMAAAYSGLAHHAFTRASSALRIFQQLGGSFGVAIVAVILQRRVTDAYSGAGGHPTLDQVAGAYGYTFWWTVAFTVAALVPALLLPRVLRTDEEESSPRPATMA
ncbi:MDR family MFS transporter [Micromonospora sp. WMMD998]|uniref:MDR family MFS transporter n=1 Tax=Micromonospora sp. WMMD998 TaxID=3016092 RepID=UPI00249ABC77|nr:MDR family MFS transporter [Micromonospora sp. WMMD998]WFE39908.1 MDR family MFS transporter [Micromonospora sp. WMMD998]